MKILFVSYESHYDIKAWSGMIYNVSKSLEKDNEIIYFDDLKIGFFQKILIAIQIFIDKLFKKKTKYLRMTPVLNYLSRKINKRLKKNDYDIVFTMRPFLLSKARTKKPIAIFADANFNSMVNYYQSFTDLWKHHIKVCNRQEKRIFDLCKVGFFTSKWAAETSADNYNIHEDKFFNINIGSNIILEHSDLEINDMIERRFNSNEKRILFVGVDWERKGGSFAVKVVYELNKLGINAKLVIIGCNPDIEEKYLSFCEIYGRIDKSKNDGLHQLDHEYMRASCFILPTKSECAAVSLVEASSYGLYSFTSNTGGTNGSIFDNENGTIMPLESTPNDYANKIYKFLLEKDTYFNKSYKSRELYKSDLNWNAIAKKINDYLSNIN